MAATTFCEVGGPHVVTVRDAATSTMRRLAAHHRCRLGLSWFAKEGDDELSYAARYGARDWQWLAGEPDLAGHLDLHTGNVWIAADMQPIDVIDAIEHLVAALVVGAPSTITQSVLAARREQFNNEWSNR